MATASTLVASPTKHPRVGVGCVVLRAGKILLGKRKGSHSIGHWQVPGGHLAFGESILDCAARELVEETGLQPTSLRLGPWVENLLEGGQKHYITLFVFADEFIGEPHLLEPDKCEGWAWFDPNNLPQPLFEPITSLFEKEGSLLV